MSRVWHVQPCWDDANKPFTLATQNLTPSRLKAMDRSPNLLDQALGLHDGESTRSARVVLIEDCVETSAAFVLHHLIKRSLSPLSSAAVIFVAFSQPFSHYDRILRKMGCNLVALRDNKRFTFLDMLTLECPGENQPAFLCSLSDEDAGKICKGGVLELYGKIQKSVEVSLLPGGSRSITILIDDIFLMEVAAKGSSSHVLDFLHYCRTLTTEFGCSLVVLNHEDIYSSVERPTLILQMEYIAEVIIKAEPLATGFARDVHGQLTVINKGNSDRLSLQNKMCSFHFRVRGNSVEYFYPGSRT
ncbi:Elongator complex protein [Actinidia chinensis var. chinensis]|uniref:Elongator complex protein n=1 Tax=Actinidia chinensis var. chinensis TaxID=1590841 RepID=A0A2R6PLU9_ACTCC|nr:Elongator complex protein [Actinidia chinensis var. chinensis]